MTTIKAMMSDIQKKIKSNQIGDKSGFKEDFLDLIDETYLTFFEEQPDPYSDKDQEFALGEFYHLAANAMIELGKVQWEGFEKGSKYPRIYQAAKDYLHLSLAYQFHALNLLDDTYCIRIPENYIPSEFYQSFLFDRPRAFKNLELVFKNTKWTDEKPEINAEKIAEGIKNLLKNKKVKPEKIAALKSTLQTLKYCLETMGDKDEGHVIKLLDMLD